MGRNRNHSSYDDQQDYYHSSTSSSSSKLPSRPSSSTTQPPGHTNSVTDLLSKLRIEQKRHVWNLARRSARSVDPSGKECGVPWMDPIADQMGPSPSLSSTSTPSPMMVQNPTTNPLHQPPLPPGPGSIHTPPTRTRRTPGPPPPLSWRQPALPNTLPVSTHLNRRGDRGRTHRIWRNYVVSRILERELMPIDGRAVRKEDEEVNEDENDGEEDRIGPISLVSSCLRLIARHLDPPSSTDLSSSDNGEEEDTEWIEHHLSTLRLAHRLAIMEWGVADGVIGWKGIRMICVPRTEVIPRESEEREEEEDDEGLEDWEKNDEQEITTTQPLPLLDLTYIPITPSSLKSLLSTCSTIRYLSLSGIGLTFDEAIRSIPESVGVRLEALGLADLRIWRMYDIEWGMRILRKWAVKLEFLDVSNSGPPIAIHPTSTSYPRYPPPHLIIKLLKDLHKDATEPTTSQNRLPMKTLLPSLRMLVAQSGPHLDVDYTSMEHGQTRGFMLQRAVGDERWLDVVT